MQPVEELMGGGGIAVRIGTADEGFFPKEILLGNRGHSRVELVGAPELVPGLASGNGLAGAPAPGGQGRQPLAPWDHPDLPGAEQQPFGHGRIREQPRHERHEGTAGRDRLFHLSRHLDQQLRGDRRELLRIGETVPQLRHERRVTPQLDAVVVRNGPQLRRPLIGRQPYQARDQVGMVQSCGIPQPPEALIGLALLGGLLEQVECRPSGVLSEQPLHEPVERPFVSPHIVRSVVGGEERVGVQAGVGAHVRGHEPDEVLPDVHGSTVHVIALPGIGVLRVAVAPVGPLDGLPEVSLLGEPVLDRVPLPPGQHGVVHQLGDLVDDHREAVRIEDYLLAYDHHRVTVDLDVGPGRVPVTGAGAGEMAPRLQRGERLIPRDHPHARTGEQQAFGHDRFHEHSREDALQILTRRRRPPDARRHLQQQVRSQIQELPHRQFTTQPGHEGPAHEAARGAPVEHEPYAIVRGQGLPLRHPVVGRHRRQARHHVPGGRRRGARGTWGVSRIRRRQGPGGHRRSLLGRRRSR
ncbi:hypothetical protein GCM10023196_016990 [Actinoallomurus vinaceus]|uniref:Uncharacterized protein n=1 Tax=Actinoallomurus vinaceus TaxID=1080074 RepID=A0ABP8U5L4_9ACTN